ncbi:MAG: Gfo/Idh/MocA family oxidoreductase [Candidatus Omnitrophica bacterium]|nr:Inositol 2-dehydrogenase/D-chiro-inositol 3-dehydrogenase [bacterium]NUN97984.1 Gfo/Idh/MocA family oxidoreductase [Candidatus Omnitrophota bacterium]
MATRVALAGYGYWGPNLARNIGQVERAELAGIFDPDPGKRELAAKRHPGTAVLSSWEETLDSQRFDALVIAAPAETHARLAEEALQAGLDILVEKPLALSVEDAFRLTLLADDLERVLMVGHTYEYNPAVEKIRVLLETGTLGAVFYGYTQRLNLGRIRDDIDAWWNLAPHDISIFNFLFQASPIRVWGQGSHHLNPALADVVFATLEYPGNILAHIHVSWLDPSKERKMTLVGAEKMVVFDDMDADARLRIYDKKAIPSESPDQYGLYHTKLHAGDILIPQLPMTEPLFAECRHFVHCVETRERPRSDGRGGVRVVQALEAVSRSIANGGGPVELESLPFPAAGLRDLR